MVPIFKCPFGGRPSGRSQIGDRVIDKDTSTLGYRVGWIPIDYQPRPGETIIIPLNVINEFRRKFRIEENEIEEHVKIPFRVRVGNYLLKTEPPKPSYETMRKIRIGDRWLTVEK